MSAAERLDPPAGARVDREQHRQLARDGRYRFEDAAEDLGIIDVGWPVQGQDCVTVRSAAVTREIEFFEDSGARRQVTMPQQRVNHHVADQKNLFLGYPFAAQVLNPALFCNEE